MNESSFRVHAPSIRHSLRLGPYCTVLSNGTMSRDTPTRLHFLGLGFAKVRVVFVARTEVGYQLSVFPFFF